MHISKNQLTIYDNELLYGIWEIYENSFPKSEMRTLSNFRYIMQKERCKVIAYHDMGNVVGFIVYWDYPDFTYLEFFAVSQKLRNGGYGAYILRDFINDCKDKPIIIEIDFICDEISNRRHNFYTREGFILNKHQHTPTAYDNKNVKLNMHIMSYRTEITDKQYEDFNKILISEIMSNIYNMNKTGTLAKY